MAQATSHKIARRYGLPFVVLPLSRFPPLCLLPGQTPAHEAMCFSEANRVISVPISARMLAAAVSSIPTTLCTNSMASGIRVQVLFHFCLELGQGLLKTSRCAPECA